MYFSKYDPVDERVLCEVTCLNNRVLKFSPDLGVQRVATRYGIYSAVVRVERGLDFDALRAVERTSLSESEAVDDDQYTFDFPPAHTLWLHYLISIGTYCTETDASTGFRGSS